MTNIGIDEVLYRLSIKFNRIIFDREFVQCVNEDLQTVIDNKNKCCVLVFPALSPNYLRLVKYQAKLCDLAVISLGSGSNKSIGVCLKKYFILNQPEEVSKIPVLEKTQMADSGDISGSATRKKRPPIQLYVPPAQRKSGTNTCTTQKKDLKKTNEKTRCRPATKTESIPDNKAESIADNKTDSVFANKTDSIPDDKIVSILGKKTDLIPDNKIESIRDNLTIEVEDNPQPQDLCFCTQDLDCFNHKPVQFYGYQCNCVKLFLFKDLFPYAKLLVFSIKRMKHSFHWIKMSELENQILVGDSVSVVGNVVKSTSSSKKLGLLTNNPLDFREPPQIISEFENRLCIGGNALFIYAGSYACNSYPPLPEDRLDNCLHCLEGVEKGLIDTYSNNKLPKFLEDLEVDLLDIISEIQSLQTPVNCDNLPIQACAKFQSNTEKTISKPNDQVIVLDERIEEVPKIELKQLPAIEPKKKQNEHEQEKEIMRKTKQNINRKTRPIIKYIDDDNDTLKIGRGDNVNNWEDLFNDDGELQEDIFGEIAQKVGKDVTIVKAVEDYSAYASKQLEELEHMVELYDFPSTLETHDIISTFKEINSDAMYVKWVDDTHALLVLGSYSQAQKALELSNSLIKVRPMSAASKLALEKANQFDLRPAMKRPQTNLQTARRLITSHLGAKSRVSKEQSAKEREDLRVAKELKRKAKQNERDAWEGNLRSSINQLEPV